MNPWMIGFFILYATAIVASVGCYYWGYAKGFRAGGDYVLDEFRK